MCPKIDVIGTVAIFFGTKLGHGISKMESVYVLGIKFGAACVATNQQTQWNRQLQSTGTVTLHFN